MGCETHFFCLVMSRLTKIVEKNLLPEMVLMNIVEDPHGHLVRVVVDGERPITISETAELIRKIKTSEDMMVEYPEGLRLEVTTPGLDQPLKEPFQYRKNRSRMLDIVFEDGEVNPKTVTGKVISANDCCVTVDHDGRELILDYSQIKTAKVKLEFN